MFSSASFSSLPCDTQPGRAGTSATIQPSPAFSSVTWNIIPLAFCSRVNNIITSPVFFAARAVHDTFVEQEDARLMRVFNLAPLIAAFAAVLILGCEAKEMEAPPRPDPRPAAKVTLESISGRMVSISDFKGRPLIVNFWASWCAPCVEEMPRFEKTYKTWKDKGLEIVAINLKESRDVAEEFMKKNGYSFTTLLDEDGEASDEFQVFGLPTTFFIDREGIIRYSHMGKVTPEILLAGLEAISLTRL